MGTKTKHICKTGSSKPDFIAECEVCGWKLESRNALGVAAQHAQRYGHKVWVEIFRTVCIEPTGKTVEIEDRKDR